MIPPQLIAQAAKLLQGKITPEDIATIGRFAKLVEQGRAKGNLGVTGQHIASLASNIFGKQYEYLSNPVIKTALDQVLQRMKIR